MPSPRAGPPRWGRLLEAWDRQQEAYLPFRERRFELMFDLVEAAVGRRFRAIDLGAGPGSLSLRLLRRFPKARAVAVDYDPVVLRLGREAVGTVDGRLTWADARLGAPGWIRALPRGKYDVALSTTALHWLGPTPLRRLYRDLAGRVRPGGVFINGDRLPWPSERRWLRRVMGDSREIRNARAGRGGRGGAWDRWWAGARRIPALREEFREQERRGSEHPHGPNRVSIADHERGLRDAGFSEVATVWQYLDDRLLLARR